MRSTTFGAAALLLSAVQTVTGQTFTDCDPTKKTCKADPALGGTLDVDFKKGASDAFTLADGTTMSYNPTLGANFTIAKGTDAPTIGTEKYIMFGRVDVKMRASAGQGTVSSFILESDDLDEIDWEWLGADDKQVQSNFFGKGNTSTYDRGAFHPVTDPVGSFHIYSIDWTAESLKWLIDGVLVRTLNFGDAIALGGKNYPQTPMRVKFGSWIGCASQAAMTDPKTKGTCEWAGGPIDLSKGSYSMFVESVKIQDYGCASEYVYGDMSGSWQSIQSKGTCNGGAISSKPASSASQTTAKPSSTSGGVLVETSVSLNSTITSNNTATATTLSTTATGAGKPTTTAAGTGTGAGAGASSSSTATGTGAPATVSGNSAAGVSPKKYGAIDVAVMVLGLGMGYLFM